MRIGGYDGHSDLLVRIPAKIAVADFVRQLTADTSKPKPVADATGIDVTPSGLFANCNIGTGDINRLKFERSTACCR